MSIQKDYIVALTRDYLSENRYNPENHTLLYTETEKRSFNDQIGYWKDYLQNPSSNRGLSSTVMVDQKEVEQLTAFFAWSAWATTAKVPGTNYSYTNNFPYEPLIGNGPSSATILWSALSLITLLGGIATILLFFGRYDYLGWKNEKFLAPPQLIPGRAYSN